MAQSHGEGQKERIVPIGNWATKLLQRFLYYFRPEPLLETRVFLCVDGMPMTENTLRLVFARLAKRAGVPWLHIHLLRHTFATHYLPNEGDVFSLQRILGHTTLEMTRRYVDMVAMEAAVRQKRPAAMDRLLMTSKAAHTVQQNDTSGGRRTHLGQLNDSSSPNTYNRARPGR